MASHSSYVPTMSSAASVDDTHEVVVATAAVMEFHESSGEDVVDATADEAAKELEVTAADGPGRVVEEQTSNLVRVKP